MDSSIPVGVRAVQIKLSRIFKKNKTINLGGSKMVRGGLGRNWGSQNKIVCMYELLKQLMEIMFYI